MKFARKILLFLILPTIFSNSWAFGADRLTVYTVNYPLQYFAQRIAGEHAEVVFPAPADEDPAFWMPDAETVAAYQKADLILLNGADYAKWTKKVSLPMFRIVDTSAAFSDSFLTMEHVVTTHSHGSGGEHAHTGTAFTTWIDLSQAIQQARAIAEALSSKRPALKATFKRNLEGLEKDLSGLDQKFLKMIAGRKDRPLVASHPVYQYLARRYGLNIRSVLWEPEQETSNAQWKDLRKILDSHPAGAMIWEGEPNPKSVEVLQSWNVVSVVFDPCGNVPEEGDFLEVMRRNVENMRAALN